MSLLWIEADKIQRQAMAWHTSPQDKNRHGIDSNHAISTPEAGFSGYVAHGEEDAEDDGNEMSDDEGSDHEDPQLHEFINSHGSNSDWWHRRGEVTQVPLSGHVYATQSHVHPHHIDRYREKPDNSSWARAQHPKARDAPADKHPVFVTHEGRLHVIDGHHRVAAALADNKPHMTGWHYDADKHGLPEYNEDQ